MNEQPVEDQTPAPEPEQDVKAKAEYEKIMAEMTKIREEIQRLRSENSPLGRLGRVVWPLVSGIVTIAVSFIALSVSCNLSRLMPIRNARKRSSPPLQMATDAKAGQDARIAGIWTLVDYWHDPHYSEPMANALAAILVTDPDGDSF